MTCRVSRTRGKTYQIRSFVEQSKTGSEVVRFQQRECLRSQTVFGTPISISPGWVTLLPRRCVRLNSFKTVGQAMEKHDTVSQEYIDRRWPYILLTILLFSAGILILIAWGFFAGGFPQDEHLVSTSGWLLGPIVCVLIYAFRTWKSIPASDRKALDLKKHRLIAIVASLCLIVFFIFTVSAIVVQIVQVRL